jgi:hypothetical protein
VRTSEGAALARKLSQEAGRPVPFIETSAKLNINVDATFSGRSPIRTLPSWQSLMMTTKLVPKLCDWCDN